MHGGPEQAVQNFMREHAEGLLVNSDGVDREFFACFVNTPHVSRLRSLKAIDLGKLAAFSGALPSQLLHACTCAHAPVVRHPPHPSNI
jgi:hypothetical protein